MSAFRPTPRTCLLWLVAAAFAAGCSDDAGPPPKPARTVAIAPVTAGPAVAPVLTHGVLAPRDELRLSFKLGGIVSRIAVREGDAVRQGQQLATLELGEIDAEVEQARQLAEKAERDRKRGDELRTARLISEGDAERLRTEAQVAGARLRAAEFNRRYAVIVAPRDGVVLRRRAEERQVLQAGQDVLVLGPVDGGFVVRAGLADRDIVKLRRGDAATVSLDAWPGVALAGTVTEIPGAASEESGLFEIEVALDPPPAGVRLVAGLLARLRIESASASERQLAYVPIGAIIEANADQATVFVAADGVARRRQVEVAFISDDAVALTRGVNSGESVITDGALYLEDGERVSIAPAPPAPPAEATGPR
jgi:RND family efflux transporter MFP subunit